jgi:hypothetical protein
MNPLLTVDNNGKKQQKKTQHKLSEKEESETNQSNTQQTVLLISQLCKILQSE